MQRDATTTPLVVRQDGTFEINNANGVAFALEKISGRGGLPVDVTVDDGGQVVRVRNTDFYPQLKPFQKLVIDTTPGGGLPGDAWRVIIAPSADDVPRANHLRDSRGVLLTASAPGAVLFDIDSRKTPQPFAELGYHMGETGTARYLYVTPTAPNVFTVGNGDELSVDGYPSEGGAWDVGTYSSVLLCVETGWTGIVPHGGSLQAFARAASTNDGRTLAELGCGSENDFISFTGADAKNGVKYARLGAAANVSTLHAIEDTRRLPYARFALKLGGVMADEWPIARFADKSYWLRMYAVGY